MGVIPIKRLDKYLRLSFLQGRKKRDPFYQIINKATSKINIWYSKFLAYARRLTLILAVTNAIPTYCMSIEKVPTTCINKLEEINKHFLRNGKKEGK